MKDCKRNHEWPYLNKDILQNGIIIAFCDDCLYVDIDFIKAQYNGTQEEYIDEHMKSQEKV